MFKITKDNFKIKYLKTFVDKLTKDIFKQIKKRYSQTLPAYKAQVY